MNLVEMLACFLCSTYPSVLPSLMLIIFYFFKEMQRLGGEPKEKNQGPN